MRSVRYFAGAIAVPLVFAVACSKGEKPDAFVTATAKAVAGEPQAIYDALPASYQKDVNDVVAAFAAKVPDKAWDDAFGVLGKTVKVLETKKEFVLGHPALKGMVKPEDVAKGWDPAVHTVSTLVNSDIKTVAGLKKLDMRAYLAGPIASIMNDLEKAADVASGAMPGKGAPKLSELRAKAKSMKTTIVKEEGDKATIKIEVEGEKEEITEMVKVEGKWIPKELADAWPKGIAEAKATIEKIKVEPAMLVQFNAMKGVLDPALDGLLAAKTQDEFNAQIDGVMKGVMGSMGGRPAGGEVAEAPVPPPSDEAAPEVGAAAAGAGAAAAAAGGAAVAGKPAKLKKPLLPSLKKKKQ